MIRLHILGFLLIISKSFGRQPPGPPPGLTVLRTGTPGQYLVQPIPRGTQPEVPPGFSQIAVVVVPRDPNQPQQPPQQYQQIIQPQQYVQPQQILHSPQQFIQQPSQVQQFSGAPQQFTSREDSNTQQIKYQQQQQQPPLLQQNIQDSSLTYIPINPVMFQKPLVDDDPPPPKSSIYVSQRTSVKKQQRLQQVNSEETEDQSEKSQPRKVTRLPPVRQFHPQQILVPIVPQQIPFQTDEGQPQLIKLQTIQQLQPEPLKYQQIQTEQQVEQQLYPQVRPKKVPSQALRQQLPQPQAQQIITYQQIPIHQHLQADPYQQQLQPIQSIDPAQLPKQLPLIKYHFTPQLIAYQPIQPVPIRQPQQLQQEQVAYEQLQEPTAGGQQEPQEVEKDEEKQEIQTQEPPVLVQKQSAKYRKSNLLRSRKYRPAPPRIQHDNEEEAQTEAQEFREDLRLQVQDGLKPQASSYASLKYRRPIQTTGKYSSRTKDRAVQIIDEEDEEYK